MLGTASIRQLDSRDTLEAFDVIARDPIANCFVGARLHNTGLDPWRLGAEVWGYPAEGPLESLCYAGANLVPVEATPAAIEAFVERCRRQGRRCSSIVGPAEQVGPLWSLLAPHWGPPRAIRSRQPVMATNRPPPASVPRDPLVRHARPEELDILLPACVAMFTEEVGVSPLIGDGGTLYRARVRELIATGRALARIDDGRVVFKAEVGAVTPRVCQLQGVWVNPPMRGRGISVAGLATVIDLVLADVAPVLSLYVNDYNLAARAAYRRVGFTECGVFSSVLF
ncbi:MAG: GNAT family N-acetyltransferase [Sporichthyaceae bacterium]|nr:GNAT family N-acetyltransferase [Sporichthyaceae bacterium]